MLAALMTAGVRVFGGPQLVQARALEQLVNVALLPGVAGEVVGLPGLVEGCVFPGGAVACFDPRAGGVLVPGAIGPDINAGTRLLRSDLDAALLDGVMDGVLGALAARVRGRIGVAADGLGSMLRHGAGGAIAHGYGVPADVDAVPWRGAMPHADPDRISARARARGQAQLGTLGGGHYIEIGCVERVYDSAAAGALGLAEGKLTALVSSDARGLGYQVCDDTIELLLRAAERYRIRLPDRQLACAPLAREEGTHGLAALAAAANFAFANRQVLTHLLRQTLAAALGYGSEALGLTVACDVPHNLASWEQHSIDGRATRVCVHRREAARALRAGHAELPRPHRLVGSPVVLHADDAGLAFVVVAAEATAQVFDSLPPRARLAALRSARLAHPVAALRSLGRLPG